MNDLETKIAKWIENNIEGAPPLELTKAYETLQNAIRIRSENEGTTSSPSTPTLQKGIWVRNSPEPRETQWTDGESIVTAPTVTGVFCNSDIWYRQLTEMLPHEFTRYVMEVIDGGGNGEVVAKYIITRLPANAEIP